MEDKVLLEQHNAWVGGLFELLLKVLDELDLRKDALDVFLVYAHENSLLNKPADANVARQLINWLEVLGVRIYPDRTAMGNPLILKTTPADTANIDDILYSQLGLLSSNHLTSQRRAQIIFCGSAVLNHYANSMYYQDTYYKELKKVCEKAQQSESPEAGRSILSTYVNAQLEKKDFHHLLTELAFLQIRLAKEHDNHGIIPFLLNGKKRRLSHIY